MVFELICFIFSTIKGTSFSAPIVLQTLAKETIFVFFVIILWIESISIDPSFFKIKYLIFIFFSFAIIIHGNKFEECSNLVRTISSPYSKIFFNPITI